MRLVSPGAREALDHANHPGATNPVVTFEDLDPATPYVDAQHPGQAGLLTAADKAKLNALGTAASADVDDFATAAQGALADSAVQDADLTGKLLPDPTGAAEGATLKLVAGVPTWVDPT